MLTTAAFSVGCHPFTSGPRFPTLHISGPPDQLCMRADYRNETFVPREISVSAREASGWTHIWGNQIDAKNAPTIEPGQCLPLDQSVNALTLNARTAYRGWAQNQRGPARAFHGDFCLIGAPGTYRIHQVLYEKRLGGQDWAPCNLKFPVEP